MIHRFFTFLWQHTYFCVFFEKQLLHQEIDAFEGDEVVATLNMAAGPDIFFLGGLSKCETIPEFG